MSGGNPERAAGRWSEVMSVALVAYGLAGLLLMAGALAIGLSVLATADRATDTLGRTGSGSLGARMDTLDATLGEAGSTLAGFDATLESTGASARDGQELGRQLARSMRELSTALDVTILGSRPFAQAGSALSGVADRADALAVDLRATADSLDANRVSLAQLTDALAALRREVAGLRADIAGPDGAAIVGGASAAGGTGPSTTELLDVARVWLVALIGWLALPALAAIIIGRRRWQLARSPATPGGQPG